MGLPTFFPTNIPPFVGQSCNRNSCHHPFELHLLPVSSWVTGSDRFHIRYYTIEDLSWESWFVAAVVRTPSCLCIFFFLYLITEVFNPEYSGSIVSPITEIVASRSPAAGNFIPFILNLPCLLVDIEVLNRLFALRFAPVFLFVFNNYAIGILVALSLSSCWLIGTERNIEALMKVRCSSGARFSVWRFEMKSLILEFILTTKNYVDGRSGRNLLHRIFARFVIHCFIRSFLYRVQIASGKRIIDSNFTV